MKPEAAGSTNNWHVITGGPSTGKTTLLAELSKLGYETVPEAARLIIDEGISSGKTIEQIRADEKDFQEKILRRKAEIESKLNPQTLCFFDRGMHDTTAYLQYYNFAIEPWAKELINKASYRIVFVLEPLPTFTKDYSRTEDSSFNIKMTELFRKAYQSGCQKVVSVPAMTLEDRLQFILERVQ